jgi:Tol biopolymer transport system component
VPYVVSELLEGESLRERLAGGPLPIRKAIEYGIQMADALGAAHEKGIVHRDVKPENAFVTREGRVKLLDFGLAKLREPDAPAGPDDSTADEASSGLRGTAAYMSPEQVLCGTIDERTDLFSLGAVLYEMFTGVQAFHRRSRVETLNAVLKENPADSPGLARLPRPAAVAIRRCLEKGREERFQSARDLSFLLQQIRDRQDEPPPPLPRGLLLVRRLLLAALALGTLAAGVAVLVAAWREPAPPRIDRLTFSRGRINGARFRNDREIVYSELRRGGEPARVFSLGLETVERTESLEARRLEALESADLLAVRGETYALSLDRHPGKGERFVGLLAKASGGGAPRPSGVEVEGADLDPSGEAMVAACTSGIGGESWLEYPVTHGAEGRLEGDGGKNKLYDPPRGSVANPRFSPDGRQVAFVEDAGGLGLGGRVMVLELASRRVEPLTEKAWASLRGLAWSRDGKEVWFAAGERKDTRALRAVTLKRQERLVYQAPGSLTLWDIGPDGRVLFSQDEDRKVIVGVPAGETIPRDLSLHDLSGVADISSDGQWILFSDRGGLFVRRIVSPTRLVHLLASGYADALSPDGRSVLVTDRSRTRLQVLTRDVAAEPRVLRNPFEVTYEGASWYPDGRRVLLNGTTKDLRAYVYDLRDDSMRALTPADTKGMTVSPDGGRIATTGGTGGIGVRAAAAGADEPSVRIKGSLENDRPVGWSADGQWLWLFRRGEMPAKVFRLNVTTGERVLWNTLVPPDPAGVYALTEFHVTPRGDAYAYSYLRVLSQLYVASGLK